MDSVEKDHLKNKAVFAVGLMAAFLAFSAYKSELALIKIQIGEFAPSLSSLFLTFIIFLALSVYFYALDYLKYSFPRFQNSIFFRIINIIAGFFYSLAILFPLLVVIFWIASGIPKPSPANTAWLFVFDIVGGTVIAVLALVNSLAQIKRSKENLIQSIDKMRISSLDRALKLFSSGFYGEAIMECFKVLESLLEEELLERAGLYTQGMSGGRMIELAVKHKILDQGTAKEADILRQMRNKAVHSDEPFTKEDAEKSLSLIRAILGKTQNVMNQEDGV